MTIKNEIKLFELLDQQYQKLPLIFYSISTTEEIVEPFYASSRVSSSEKTLKTYENSHKEYPL